MSLFDQPNMKELLRDYAVHTNRFVFFIGAGLSANAGLPSWEQLKTRLLQRHREDGALLASKEERKARLSHVRTIQNLPDPWLAFSSLKGAMNKTSYESTINEALSYPDEKPLPALIKKPWELRTYGVVTLNVDSLLHRAYIETHARQLQQGVGCNLENRIKFLSSDKPWLVNLHGVVGEESTWIFAKEDLELLFRSEAYLTFMRVLFASCRVVFVGVSVDDIAIARHLESIKAAKIRLAGHYWITNRADERTAKWASENDVKAIFYSTEKNSHSDALSTIFEKMESHAEYYSPAPPVIPSSPVSKIKLSPQDVKAKTPEEARVILSSYAAKILNMADPEGGEAGYESFLREYTEAVNHASLVEDFPPYNVLFGCELLPPPIGGGAFGRVYVAEKGANKLAVKLINPNVRSDKLMLNSFRQGVESLRILREVQADGVVELIDAYEIPPTIIMEYVDGSNIEELSKARKLDRIAHVLPLMRRVVEIIRKAHDHKVLHRDIRPSNIMLREFDRNGFDKSKVVILDFDLSWHNRGKDYRVSENMTNMLGYLAPEQLVETVGADRKVAEVDVYGLGMTLYFLISGNHPQTNERNSKQWDENIKAISRIDYKCKWKSIGNRLARIINDSTEIDQNRRIDISSFDSRLGLIEKVANWPDVEIWEMSYWVEEISARAFGVADYFWDEGDISSLVSPLPNWSIRVCGKESATKSEIILTAEYSEVGDNQFNRVSKYWPDRLSEIRAKLKIAGWNVDENITQYDRYTAKVGCSINLKDAIKSIDSVVKSMEFLREKIGQLI